MGLFFLIVGLFWVLTNVYLSREDWCDYAQYYVDPVLNAMPAKSFENLFRDELKAYIIRQINGAQVCVCICIPLQYYHYILIYYTI